MSILFLNVAILLPNFADLFEKIKKTKPPLSLYGQLLWREFFYCAATKNKKFDRMKGNPICVQIPWDKNAEALAKWANVSRAWHSNNRTHVKVEQKSEHNHKALALHSGTNGLSVDRRNYDPVARGGMDPSLGTAFGRLFPDARQPVDLVGGGHEGV